MTFPFRRRSRPRFNGSPSDHDDTQYFTRLRTDEADGTTWPAKPGHVTFGGVSGTGLPDGTVQPYEQAETGILYEDAQPAPRTEPAAQSPQPPPITGRVLDTLNYLRLKVAILEAAGDADRIDASEQGRRDGQQLLSWSPLRQVRDDAVALLRGGTS